MTEPEIAPETGESGSRGTLLVENLIVSALVFALLEFWRPLYFLTDDNLDGGFPLFTEIGRRLAAGKSPFISDYIFGGNYHLLRDCTFFVWHPFNLLASLLAVTPAHFLIMDVVAFLFLMLATAGFVCLACFLRDEFKLHLSDGRLMLLALSFNYSMIVLTTGSSWLNFLGNHSALPWLALGILQTNWRRGFGLVALFSLHHLLGGHLAATISDSLCLSLFAVGIAFYRRSLLPVFSWFGGYLLAVLILLPLLLPALSGFSGAPRADGLSVDTMSKFAIPAGLFPASLFLGTFSILFPFHYGFGMTHPVYSSAFVSCAAAWMVIPALISRARWRGLELLCLGLALLLAVMIIRPLWISEIMVRLPLLRSMRWPFREILQFQFFFHLFLILRPPGGSDRLRRVTTTTGLFIFIFPLFCLPAPSFDAMRVDRALVLSGGVPDYWDKVRPLVGPEGCIAAVADMQLRIDHPQEIPYSLLGAYNYPILGQVRVVGGYSVTAPRDQLYLRVVPAVNIDLYSIDQMNEIFRERPGVKCVVLESIDPLRIVLHSVDGSTVDLTPFVPMDKIPKSQP